VSIKINEARLEATLAIVAGRNAKLQTKLENTLGIRPLSIYGIC
jgi:hypothetical protein